MIAVFFKNNFYYKHLTSLIQLEKSKYVVLIKRNLNDTHSNEKYIFTKTTHMCRHTSIWQFHFFFAIVPVVWHLSVFNH